MTTNVTKNITGPKATLIMQWLSWADKDYVAARRLLLDGFLVQGTSLANTAIEKYLKAILTAQDQAVQRIHDPLRLYHSLPSTDKLQLDITFLELLGKAYKMRYPDDLPSGFNISLCQFLILSTLDESVATITAKFAFIKLDGDKVVRFLDSLIANKNTNAIVCNTALGVISRDELFALPSKVYENRLLAKDVWMEVEYVTAQIENRDFMREGFVQINDRQFQLSHLPIGEKSA